MTTQLKPSVEIAIDKLVKSLSYEPKLYFTLKQALESRRGRDFSSAINYLDPDTSEQERIAHIVEGIAQMRSSLEMQIFDLNTIEAEFSDVLQKGK